MTRDLVTGGMYGDHLPSGGWCVLIPQQMVLTHLGALALPPNDRFGPLFVRATDVNGFRFAGQAHDTLNPACWEYDSQWISYPPPACGVSPVIYDHDGVLHRSDCGPGVGSQGYRYVDSQNQLVSGDATYGPFHGLFEYTDLGDGLWIGQAAYDGGGVQVWDDTHANQLPILRQLETGNCRFIRANRAGEVVALAFTRPEGVVLIATTMAELRALPPVVTKPVDPPIIPPVDPIDPPVGPVEPPIVPPKPEPIPPTPEPPKEPEMIAYAPPVPGFLAGELVDNDNGTVSVLKPNGKYLCVTPDGGIEERDSPGGLWESFTQGATSLIAERDGGNRGPLVYVLPMAQ